MKVYNTKVVKYRIVDEVVPLQPAARGGPAGARAQDTVRQDREHQEPAALTRPGNSMLLFALHLLGNSLRLPNLAVLGDIWPMMTMMSNE